MPHSLHHHISSLTEFFTSTSPKVSFEFFPPKTTEMEEKLWASIRHLAPLKPAFVSVTYGAGGTTRERTHATVKRILEETDLLPAAHLTCVGTTMEEVDAIIQDYWNMGVRHIVALRGDPPEGMATYQPHPGGYAYACDLVKGLKKIGDFEISVAAYPETHPEAENEEKDLAYLKKKIDAGATRAITQYFFDPDMYLRFLEKAEKKGITVPIVPGILPVTHFKQVVQFSARCGASIPSWMQNLFEGLDEDPITRNLVAAIMAVEQCRRLKKAGVEEFHFYTLNRAELTLAICHVLGLRVQS